MYREEKISGKEIYNGRILKLENDIVRLSNGKEAQREVVRHSGGACVLAVNENNELYLVKQFRYPFDTELYEIPAGKINENEDPFECAKRELKEETGATAQNWTFLGEMIPTPAYCSEKIYIYAAENLELGQSKLDEDEFLDVIKIPFSNAYEMVKHNQIKDAKTVFAILYYEAFRLQN